MSEIEEVKARLDIVDVVGQSVHLQKSGRTFKAPCPFHNEKTPSFIVNSDRQTWHCFGACGTGGDVISFVMKREGIEFGEALRMLAERAGVKLKERRVSEEQDRARQRLHDANDAAAAYFQRQLTTDAGLSARDYVERRQIDDETARSFGLGYSAPGWESLLEHLRGLRFTDREIVGAGLALQGDRGLHDRFRNRLMFPVWDAKGRTIGFGARALDPDAVPKYLNTAQTPLFDKSGTLYALNKAGESIRREGRAVIVEGYMDVIAAHQFGFTNVVAQMGTALTERQVRLLKRLTGQLVLALDADAAGTEAAVRGHDVVRETERAETGASVSWRGLVGHQEASAIDLRVVVVPHGKDPDDFIRENPDGWRELIEQARPVLDFRLDVAAAAHDLTDPRGRSQLVQEYLPLLSAVADPVVRAHYLTRLARLAQVGEEELTRMIVRPKSAAPDTRRPAAAGARAPRADPREGFLLALLIQYPQLHAQADVVSGELLWDTEARQMLEIWRESDGNVAKEALPIELTDYLERLILWKLPLSNEKEAAEALQDCVEKLHQRRLQAEKQAIAAQIADLQEQRPPSTLTIADDSGGEPREGGAETQFPDTDQLQLLLQRDMEIGWELHKRDRREGHLTANIGREAVESTIDG